MLTATLNKCVRSMYLSVCMSSLRCVEVLFMTVSIVAIELIDVCLFKNVIIYNLIETPCLVV